MIKQVNTLELYFMQQDPMTKMKYPEVQHPGKNELNTLNWNEGNDQANKRVTNPFN